MKGGKRMSLHSLEKYLLETIYYHQTLTFSQLNVFEKQLLETFRTKQPIKVWFKILVQQQYLTVEKTKDLSTEKSIYNYFLTTQGIQAVKDHLNLPDNQLSETKKVLVHGYYQASKLRPKKEQIDRQNRLNDFEILVRYYLQHYNITPLNYHYFDRKFFNEPFKFTGAQGMMELFGRKFLIHVEGKDYSETGLPKLFQQTYLKQVETSATEGPTPPLFYTTESDLTVLVLATSEEKAKTWEQALYPVLKPLLSPHFDLVVGTKKQLLNYLFHSYLSQMKQQQLWKKQVEQEMNRLGTVMEYQYLLPETVNGYYQGVVQAAQPHQSMLFSYEEGKAHATLQAYLNHIMNYETFLQEGYPPTFLFIVKDKNQFIERLTELSTVETTFLTPLSYVTTLEDLKKADTWENAILQHTSFGWEKGVLPKHLY